MTKFDQNPISIFDNIQELLTVGATNRNHAFHTPVFSNISKENLVNSRTVVLRSYNKKSLILNFHTDIRSPKVKELIKNNNSYFVFYDFELKTQLRIKTVSKINNQNTITKSAWKKTHLFSRKCYLTKKSPSSKTKFPEDGIPKHLIGIDPKKDESELGYKNFVVVQNHIQNIDWLFLSSSGHKRLNINFEKNKKKFDWVIP
tara:strand:- start:425 stop:1030 length:606 start_codon:yes stop_codon:yes gene_type:complete